MKSLLIAIAVLIVTPALAQRDDVRVQERNTVPRDNTLSPQMREHHGVGGPGYRRHCLWTWHHHQRFCLPR